MKFKIIYTPKNAKIDFSNVANAVYMKEYKIRIFFEDESVKTVDFKAFLFDKHTHPMYKRYRKPLYLRSLR